MDGSNTTTAVSADDISTAPESWEVADLDESVRKLKLSISVDNSSATSKDDDKSSLSFSEFVDDGSGFGSSVSGGVSAGMSEEVLSQVDLFLREALQNPRERLSGKFCLFRL